MPAWSRISSYIPLPKFNESAKAIGAAAADSYLLKANGVHLTSFYRNNFFIFCLF
jgi:hypothetical protein